MHNVRAAVAEAGLDPERAGFPARHPYLAHRAQREAAILSAVEAGETTVDAVVGRVYVDVPEALHPIARFSVHAHLLKLADEGRVEGAELDGKWEIPVGKRR